MHPRCNLFYKFMISYIDTRVSMNKHVCNFVREGKKGKKGGKTNERTCCIWMKNIYFTKGWKIAVPRRIKKKKKKGGDKIRDTFGEEKLLVWWKRHRAKYSLISPDSRQRAHFSLRVGEMVENTNFGKACSFSEINPVEWDEEGGRYGWWKRREVGETSSERIESVSEVSIIIRSKADYCRDYPRCIYGA